MTDQLLDFAEHELRSLRSWLAGMFPDHDIWVTRPPADFSRPAFRISETAQRSVEDQGRALQRQVANWQIEVLFGNESNPNPQENRWEVTRVISAVTNKALRSRLIPLYLWGWRYLQPQAKELPASGSIPAGEVSVRVTAVNAEGEESLASEAAVVDVGANASVQILIPPWPRGDKVAKEFRVYAGAVDSETFQMSVAPEAGPIPSIVSLDSLAVGAVPPSSSRFFSQRFMRVDTVTSELLEHPDMDGVFNGFVSLRLLTQLVRDDVVDWAEVLDSMTVRLEV